MTSLLSSKTRWSKQDIRAARKVALAPLLSGRRYRLGPLPNDNFRILSAPDYPSAPACPEPCRGAGLVIKSNFWTWPDRDISGNTIDFFTKIEGLSFHQAMQVIMTASDYDTPEQNIQEHRGNISKNAR